MTGIDQREEKNVCFCVSSLSSNVATACHSEKKTEKEKEIKGVDAGIDSSFSYSTSNTYLKACAESHRATFWRLKIASSSHGLHIFFFCSAFTLRVVRAME